MAAQRVRRNRILFAATISGQNFLEIVMRIVNKIESSESDDDNFEENMLIENISRIRGKQQKPVRITGYVENVIPRYTTKQFRHHFRMLPEVFEDVENRLGRLLSNAETFGRPMISVRIQLLSTIWLLATPDSFRSVSEKFDLAKSSLNACVRRVVKALNNIASEVIKWPAGPKLTNTKEKFIHIGHTPMPGVVGAIDGCFIFIKKPDLEEIAIHYKCRKLQYAVVLQAICDADLLFTDCFAGYPGSVGDYRIFRNSYLYREVNRNLPTFFPEEEFIVGDKAYPVLTWCIPPFRNNGRLTQNQKKFNQVISQKRQIIERAFALLKGRFRRLRFLDMSRLDLIPFFIIAACVLHNICLEGIDDDIEGFVEEGRELYEEENNDDVEYNDDDPEYNDRGQEFVDGEIKRNYLCLRVAGR